MQDPATLCANHSVGDLASLSLLQDGKAGSRVPRLEAAAAPAAAAAAAAPAPTKLRALTNALWAPITLTAAYLVSLRLAYLGFRKLVTSGMSFDHGVYSTVWLAGPVSATILCVALPRPRCSDVVVCTAPLPPVSHSLNSPRYLTFIKLGTKYMSTREPMNLKAGMFTYNLYQCVLNAWMVCAFVIECRRAGMSVWGNPLDLSERSFRLGFVIWVHYNNKYLELMDTVFMVLRKKTRQVSFLHCYHHVLLIWAWFAVCKYGCGGDVYFGALLNSFIHVLMYGYYTMSLVGMVCPWKRHLTKCQLLQFAVCLTHTVYCWVTGNYPWKLCLIEIWVMVNMLVLFGNFYLKSYSDAKKKKSDRAAAAQGNGNGNKKID